MKIPKVTLKLVLKVLSSFPGVMDGSKYRCIFLDLWTQHKIQYLFKKKLDQAVLYDNSTSCIEYYVSVVVVCAVRNRCFTFNQVHHHIYLVIASGTRYIFQDLQHNITKSKLLLSIVKLISFFHFCKQSKNLV